MNRLYATLLLFSVSFCVTPGSATPPENYWQQEVNYTMDVTLHHDLRTIDGYIDIEYVNNSPDTLHLLYLKAFPNAIQRDSYADRRQRRQNDYSFASLTPEQEGRLELHDRSGAIHSYSSFDVDNTIITVRLIKPLLPHDTLVLSFDFATTLPVPARMRMGLYGGTIKAAYWYPQVCVYDRKMGWVNSQYLGWGECYGDFGRFDVTIHAPEDQIIAATGELMNRSEAMPDSLRRLLDIANFSGPRETWPSLPLDSKKYKTWHFLAERVSDFAWTASNNFCIDSGSVDSVAVVAYALRPKAKLWRNAVRLGKEAVSTFSELYYPYQWPVIRIVDAFSGMEYPMLTNCGGGRAPNRFALLLYHEIGHQWFMGQVGSNQVDRPFLDEGFTTHLEHIAMEKYLGREGNYDAFTNWYQRTFAPPTEDREARGFLPLLLLMQEGLDRPMLYSSYDQGKEYWPYRVSAYYKSAAMHYSLRSILGDSLYFAAMRHYCHDWFFKHPYEDDFTRSLEEATGLELDQYLEQWYYRRDRLDYAFAGKKTRKKGSTFEHTIKLKRPGDFVAPVDIAVIWEQGDTTCYTAAPEGMQFAKPGCILLPAWNQFRRKEPTYQFTIKSSRKIRKVVVDPNNLLMDSDRRNNQSGLWWPTETRLDNLLYDRPLANKYILRIRPDLWYNEPNGIEIGGHLHGSYLKERASLSLDARIATETGRPFVDASWSNPFTPFGPGSYQRHRLLHSDYRTFIRTALEKRFTKWYSRPDYELFRFELDYLDVDGDQPNRRDPLPSKLQAFLPDPAWDATTTYYGRLSTGLLRTFRYGSFRFFNREGVGVYEEEKRHRGFVEHQIVLELTLTRKKHTWLSWRGETWFSSGEPPSPYLTHLSRVRAVDRFVRSPLFRNPGTFPTRWEKHFYLDNARVRGYEDRVIYVTDFAGSSVELIPLADLRRVVPQGFWPLNYLRRASAGVFADIGWTRFDGKEKYYREPIASNESLVTGTDEIYVSAGLFLQLPSLWKKHRVRIDLPLYLSNPKAGESPWEFRASVVWQLPSEF